MVLGADKDQIGVFVAVSFSERFATARSLSALSDDVRDLSDDEGAVDG
jgi:hypothetical protein